MSKPHKFRKGDLVHIAKDLGPCMKHFPSDRDAVIDRLDFDEQECGVIFADNGEYTSWYPLDKLKFIRHVGIRGLKRLKTKREKIRKQESDLRWIVKNWTKIRGSVSGATMQALADAIGFSNLWGSRGEGIDYYLNARFVFRLVDDVLLSGNYKKVVTDLTMLKAIHAAALESRA